MVEVEVIIYAYENREDLTCTMINTSPLRTQCLPLCPVPGCQCEPRTAWLLRARIKSRDRSQRERLNGSPLAFKGPTELDGSDRLHYEESETSSVMQSAVNQVHANELVSGCCRRRQLDCTQTRTVADRVRSACASVAAAAAATAVAAIVECECL